MNIKDEAVEAALDSACLSYRHDFGLLPEQDRETLRRTAKWWLEAWQKALTQPSGKVSDEQVRAGVFRAITALPNDAVGILNKKPFGVTLESVVRSILEAAQLTSDNELLPDQSEGVPEISKVIVTPSLDEQLRGIDDAIRAGYEARNVIVGSAPTPAIGEQMEVVAIAWNYMGRPCVDTKFVPDKHAVEAGHITDIEPLARHSDATRIITACQQEVERLRDELIKSRNYWSEQCSDLNQRNAELVKALEKLTHLYEQEFDPESLKRPDWLVAALKGQSNG